MPEIVPASLEALATILPAMLIASVVGNSLAGAERVAKWYRITHALAVMGSVLTVMLLPQAMATVQVNPDAPSLVAIYSVGWISLIFCGADLASTALVKLFPSLVQPERKRRWFRKEKPSPTDEPLTLNE